MILGRERERRALLDALDGARESRGGALVLRGEAGIGKSALLTSLLDADAAGMRVLRTQGIESESPLAFAALHRLLLPLLDRLDRLPPPQARALSAQMLGHGPVVGSDERVLVFLGALTLITDAAEDAPLVCLVDDAHWLDDASAAALLFISRRIDVSPVAMVFAARDGDARRFDAADLPSVRLEGLEPGAAEALLQHSAAGHELAPAVRRDLIARTGGNPLALMEIPRALTESQVAGLSPLSGHLPLTDHLERVFLDRVRRLPAGAQTHLLIAAIDDTGSAAVIRRASELLGVAEAEADAAEHTDLIAVTGSTLEMRHPLVRSALHWGASLGERRRVHAALANALELYGDLDRAIWHRAAAVDGPEEETAELLAQAAERFRLHGGHEAASAAFERAAQLSENGDRMQQRLFDAANSAWLAGDPERTRVLAQRVRATATSRELQAEADRLRAFVEMNYGSVRLAHGILAGAAGEALAASDAERARRFGMIATALAAFGAESGATIDVRAIAALEPGTTGRSASCFTALLLGMDHMLHDRLADGAAELRRALELGEGLPHTDLLTNLGIAALTLGDDEAALRWHDRQLDAARANSSVQETLHALTRRALVQLPAGRWSELRAAGEEVLDLARAAGHENQLALPLAQLLVIDAYRGAPGVAARADEVEQLTRSHPSGVLEAITLDLTRWARGIEAARDDPREALRCFQAVQHRGIAQAAAIDLIEVAVRSGDADAVARSTGQIAGFAAATGNSWAHAIVEHAKALSAQTEERERHFRSALEHHASSMRPLSHARTRLAYGEYLRRARRRVDAREQFRIAASMFDELKVAPWADRARDELRASGETMRRHATGAELPSLTAQELQVARHVQEGLSNREVAARLFVSPRTVEFHLRNIFAKLGIASRAALANVPLDPAA
ncbi:ATP-binding protein [Ruicaihuangia caeni]|uniref:ATP-binding protein n=1 Tax=Ruicaihuangia caeni TaxID=3042517 RepID=UPI00338EB79A